MMWIVFGELYIHEEWCDIVNILCELCMGKWRKWCESTDLQTLWGTHCSLKTLSSAPSRRVWLSPCHRHIMHVAQDDGHLMWSSSTSLTPKKQHQTNHGQSSNDDLHHFDHGVINLTWWKNDDNGTKAGSSSILQKWRRSQSAQQANTTLQRHYINNRGHAAAD